MGSISNMFGGLLGETDAQYQAKLAGQRANDAYGQSNNLMNQTLQGYNQYSNQANQYRTNAGNTANNYANMAMSDRTNGQDNLNNLLKTYSAMNGIAAPTTAQPAASPASPAVAAGNRTTPGTGGTMATTPTTGGSAPLGPQPVQQQQQQGGYFDLTPGQQAQLNQQVDQHSQAGQNAVADYRARMAQMGRSPDPAAEQEIAQTFAAQSEQAKAQFAEQARAERTSALNQMMGLYNQMQGQGTQNYGNSVGMQENLANSANAQANNPTLPNLANSQQNQGNVATQQQYQQMQDQGLVSQALGSILGMYLPGANILPGLLGGQKQHLGNTGAYYGLP